MDPDESIIFSIVPTYEDCEDLKTRSTADTPYFLRSRERTPASSSFDWINEIQQTYVCYILFNINIR